LLRTVGTFLKWLILLPILAAIVALAVANGDDVTVYLNPFDRADLVLKFDLPLYQLGFALFVLGALVGGLVVWSSGVRSRRRERARSEAALFEARPVTPDTSAPTPSAAGFLPRPSR